jgi:uncharacterized protein (TIRG00374 family)
MLKKILLNGLKIGLATGLMIWLVQSGKLDWEVLAGLRRYPHRLLLAFGFCCVNLLLITWRWRNILQARTRQHLPFSTLFQVNWIGQFFGTVLPGSVTGDVVKVLYVRKQDPTLSHAFLLFSCLLDRLMGLTGLVLLMGLFSVINYGALVAMSPRLGTLLNFNFAMLAAVTAGLAFYFLAPDHWQQRFETWAAHPERVKFALRIAELWKDLTSVRKQVALAVGISFVVQFLSVVIFYLLVHPQFQTNLSLDMVLSFIPLGFMAVALPISPAGLGVGHAAFEGLFAIAGEQGGANFFNMYFVVLLVFNLLGVIPWVLWRQRKSAS